MRAKVTINFEIDDEIIEVAILHCQFFKIKPTKKNIISVIKDQVYQKGISVIHFTEHWGDDLFAQDYPDNMEKILNKFK